MKNLILITAFLMTTAASAAQVTIVKSMIGWPTTTGTYTGFPDGLNKPIGSNELKSNIIMECTDLGGTIASSKCETNHAYEPVYGRAKPMEVIVTCAVSCNLD